MFTFFKLVVYVVIICGVAFTQAQIKVSVYYEALCPDSMTFFTRHLYPTYLTLGSHLDIKLIPYGKAIQNRDAEGKWEFQCQHGQRECYGNKVQACVLKLNFRFSKQMEYINCLMSKLNPDQYGKICADEVGIPWDPISVCAHTETGSEYLAEMGNETHSLEPQISFVPTIRFNDLYNDDLQWESLKRFRDVVCKLIGQPQGCISK